MDSKQSSVTSLLFIYPKNGCSKEPVDDEYTKMMEELYLPIKKNVWREWSLINEDRKGFREREGRYNPLNVGVVTCDGKYFRHDTMTLGVHTCICGEQSLSYDFFLPGNSATNSLCLHYLKWHRDEIPKSELKKIKNIYEKVFLTGWLPKGVEK